jgi:hypothetical protein
LKSCRRALPLHVTLPLWLRHRLIDLRPTAQHAAGPAPPRTASQSASPCTPWRRPLSLTMTATVSGIDASGRHFDQVIVFDRE